ncbi:hypothetical protein SCHPADRAFT_912477 [Schizopora paradoxa]|uniref:Integrase core domain-containing protein n=1 Tax=Schizopora paradoxa TaxID=27342 RepID=A0A0H2S736_9AGAM|nr:hypothetical protein SCHPADRAFT_912477 [Schizopora paradoxa]
MPNPTGKNGHGVKQYPPDDILKAHLVKNASKRVKEKLLEIKKEFGLEISGETLRKIERRLEVRTVRRNGLTEEEAVAAVISQVEKDINQNNGPRFVKDVLALQNILLPRNFIRNVMLEACPEGFDKRVPSSRKQKIKRIALTSIGPYAEFCADGHEKLAPQALKMGGNVGLPIYGYKDKFSGYVFLLKTIPDCRSAGAIGHLFLNMVEELKHAPLQLTTDAGAETVWESAIQGSIREVFTPEVDVNSYPPHRTIPSVHNTPIEGFWPWWKLKMGLNARERILSGEEAGLYNGDLQIHRNLFNWIFPRLLQESLDLFRDYWNSHRIRTQDKKLLPSGHIPSHVLVVPEEYGYIDCSVPVDQDAIDEIRQHLTEEVGPAEDFFKWNDADFEEICTQVHHDLELPPITWENSWDIFTPMARELRNLLE